ncbi:MAG: hypothetical protein AAF663_05615 [Planctomycetota bacterium]
MQMTIDCPRCGTPLLVPETAAGRKARCTSCEAKFVIPSAEEMLDMTVSHMVLEELTMRRGESEVPEDQDLPDPDGEPHEVVHEPEPTQTSKQADADAAFPRTATPAAGASSGGTVIGIPVAAEVNDRSAVMSHDEILAGGDQDGEIQVGGGTALSGGTADASAYPQELIPRDARPYLVVREVSTDGVIIAFASRWLRNEVFRCSMPMRCCASGATLGPNQKLSARPMVFVNRTTTGEDRARSLELKYETDNVGQRTPRELVREIGRMNDLTQPYDLPMLYYVQAGRPVDAMVCRAISEGDGDVTGGGGDASCEVRVPNGQVAVQWLERVNGRCGPEYAQLRTDVAHLSSDAWSQLPINVRQRLEPWTRFQRGEKFLLYLNDPDFASNDAGLAGVVITDQRLIYHKYRRLRSVALNQDATLHVRPDPTTRVVRLTLESAGRMARAGKIHRTDMPKLIECLSDARLRVMVGGG